jgi:hypothetical protein
MEKRCHWHWEILDLLRTTLEEEFEESDPRMIALLEIEELVADWCCRDHPEQHQ